MKKRVLCTGITSSHLWPAFCELQKRDDIELFGIKPPKAKDPSGPRIFSASFSHPEAIKLIFHDVQPTHVLHAAGICDLDASESNPDWTHQINVIGTRLIRGLSENIYFMYCSADLVFSGVNPPENGYAEDSQPNPVSIVGKTMAMAEKEVSIHKNFSILRVGLPMGDSVQGYKGPIDWIENRFKRGLPVTLFYDEYRSAIHTDEIGKMITELFLKEVQGIFHVGGPEPVSLYQMGQVISEYSPAYDKNLLKGRFTREEKNGPPRVINIHMDSSKTYQTLGWKARKWPD